jgi:hypothetical protein
VQWLAAAPLAAAAGGVAHARTDLRIERLLEEARALSPAPADIGRRIDTISRALVGARYRSQPLIGGPAQPEQFVVRADAFDCVTYCETVLAAAIARDYAGFETALKRIRYRNGEVAWEMRNHYFAEWCRQAIANGICRQVTVAGSVTINKTVAWGEIGRQAVSLTAVPRGALLEDRQLLSTGDIIGFVSRRSNLDVFHTGIVVAARGRAPLLRHASKSRRRVVQERLDRFLAVNGVRHVTLLRPMEGIISN